MLLTTVHIVSVKPVSSADALTRSQIYVMQGRHCDTTYTALFNEKTHEGAQKYNSNDTSRTHGHVKASWSSEGCANTHAQIHKWPVKGRAHQLGCSLGCRASYLHFPVCGLLGS